MRMHCLVGLAVVALALATGAAARPTISSDTVTISGISAGAAFAVQYEYAFSKTVRAAGIVAGVPYWCAQDSLTTALSCMSSPESIILPALYDHMNHTATRGGIDPVSGIASHYAMLWSGIDDTLVSHGAMLALGEMYQQLGVRGERLVTYFNYSSEHAWITDFYGNACGHLGEPFVNNCGVDFAGNFLRGAFAHMGVPFNATRGVMKPSRMFKYNAGHFGADGLLNSLDATAYYYVPEACDASATNATTQCHLHINFHGCEQQSGSIGDRYVMHTGLNQWAESNNIIVVYPQTTANILLVNPKACFDWWGYDDAGYATKSGTQMAIVRATEAYLLAYGHLPPHRS